MTDRHARCEGKERFSCPCWEQDAREEGQMHRTRPATRELTDYIRAVGDHDPAKTTREMADLVARVFGSPLSAIDAALAAAKETGR